MTYDLSAKWINHRSLKIAKPISHQKKNQMLLANSCRFSHFLFYCVTNRTNRNSSDLPQVKTLLQSVIHWQKNFTHAQKEMNLRSYKKKNRDFVDSLFLKPFGKHFKNLALTTTTFSMLSLSICTWSFFFF